MTKILWSGITGRTGKEAVKHKLNNISIVAGVNRKGGLYYTSKDLDKIKEQFDVIVDFSNKDFFDDILDFAIKHNKPFVCGTSGLSEKQLKKLYEASYVIPIFRSGNFQFQVKDFINKVIKYAENVNAEEIYLIETHYKTKKVPSQTALEIASKVYDKTKKKLIIESKLEFDEIINEWKVGELVCRVTGFSNLAKDILIISSMLEGRAPNGIYDLENI